KEYVGVLGGATDARAIRREAVIAESSDRFFADHRLEVVVTEHRDLIDLVRGTEAVEEMEEGDAAFERGGMGNGGKIVRFLDRSRAEHGESGLAASHHI